MFPTQKAAVTAPIARGVATARSHSPDFSPRLDALGGLPEGRASASLWVFGAKLWSAAACCRFPPRELARGNFELAAQFPASKLAGAKAAASCRTPKLRNLCGLLGTVIIKKALQWRG